MSLPVRPLLGDIMLQILRRAKAMHITSPVPGRVLPAGNFLLSSDHALPEKPPTRRGGAMPSNLRLQALSLVAADSVAAMCALAGAYWIAAGSASDVDGLNDLLPWIGAAVGGVILHLASHGHYVRRLSPLNQLYGVAFASFGALLGTAMAAYLTQEERARLPVLLVWALFPCLVFAARAGARAALDAAGHWRVRVVLVGTAQAADAARGAMGAAAHLGYVIAGEIAPDALPRQGTVESWRHILAQHRAGMVVFAFDGAERPSPTLIEPLVRNRIPLAVVQETGGLPSLACAQSAFPGHDSMMLCYATGREKTSMHIAKSILDVSLASIALLALLPLFAIIAAVIKLDGGPVFFAHGRLGSQGRAFRCLKFRTMVQDSDAVLARLLAEDPAAAREWAATQKLRHDPRVTFVGRVLRKTSLDELPQLINVVRLEMSLVGPRPIVSREVARYADDISYYFETRPGITGLWQISGRNDTSYARRVELDRWYVKNWSIGNDISILLRTIPAVLSGRGAS
jgi:undecaprenyl-phosphate galactose phosphotransferase